jgi:site-specific DNA-methyltransferase (adenine-specific)
VAAKRCGRDYVGFELNPDYCAIAQLRLTAVDNPDQPYAREKVQRRPRAKAGDTKKAAVKAAGPKPAGAKARPKAAAKAAVATDADTPAS